MTIRYLGYIDDPSHKHRILIFDDSPNLMDPCLIHVPDRCLLDDSEMHRRINRELHRYWGEQCRRYDQLGHCLVQMSELDHAIPF